MVVEHWKKRNKTKTTKLSPKKPRLRFTPYAWAKLVYLRDAGPSEIGGFGITSASDLLLVENISLVKQRCTSVTVAFDDQALADFFDDQVDAGRQPAQFSRIWVHTHPFNCPKPSSTDEATFERVFGAFDWSVMAIVARDDSAFARLQYQVGPGGSWQVPFVVDYSHAFAAADHQAWRAEYDSNVIVEPLFDHQPRDSFFDDLPPDDWPFSLNEWEEQIYGAPSPRPVRPATGIGAPGTHPA